MRPAVWSHALARWQTQSLSVGCSQPSRKNGGPFSKVGITRLPLGLRIMKRTGAIPENVNFAVNGKYAQELVERSEVPYQTATTDETLSTPAIAERALKLTVLVQCFR